MDNNTEKQMYFVRRGYSLTAKNNLQKEFLEAVSTWDHYLIESVADFHVYAQRVADYCHQKHPRCRPLTVNKPNLLGSNDGRYGMWVNDFMHFELYPLVGSWTKEGGFQQRIPL